MDHPGDQPSPPKLRTKPDSEPQRALDYDRLRKQLLRSVARVCPPWLADRREDIVQASLLRVMKAAGGTESNPGPPASYLWKVAYSATVDEIRRHRRRREVPMETLGPENPKEAATASNPFEDRSLHELGRAVRSCLETLVESRRLVVGFHLMGHTVSEMKRLLDTNDKRVRNLLFRGMTDLRSCLSDKGFRP